MKPNKIFHPNNMGLTAETILNMVNTELSEVHEVPLPEIDINHPKFTSSFCQLCANLWHMENNGIWVGEDDMDDDFHQFLVNRFCDDKEYHGHSEGTNYYEDLMGF